MVGKMGHRMFEHLAINSVEVAKQIIDTWDDGDQNNMPTLIRLSKIAAASTDSAMG